VKDHIWMLAIRIQSILKGDEGQDLIEYALVVALIALTAAAGIRPVATAISTAFSSIATKFTTYTA
jgi:pilus assembly protein Flp/PilA